MDIDSLANDDGTSRIEELLDIANDLDSMDRDVTAWEGELPKTVTTERRSLLESCLKKLEDGMTLSNKQEKLLRELHERYLG